MSPEAYQPLSTFDRNEQLSNVGVVTVVQSMSPGFLMTCPVVVSYHCYRKPLKRFRLRTSVSVARSRSRSCARLIKPRSPAETVAHRYTPMLDADVYLP